MKKLSYYISGIYFCLLSSFLIAEDAIYLWDLGMKIKTQSPDNAQLNSVETALENADKKFASLTKRHVPPKYVNVELKNSIITEIDFSTLNDLEKYKLGNKYFISGRYVETIKLLEMVELSKLNIKEREHLMRLHLDALFNLGHFTRIVNILTGNEEYVLNDDLLFLLGISSTKLGHRVPALEAFNQIVENYPNSEYQNISKLQVRVLKR